MPWKIYAVIFQLLDVLGINDYLTSNVNPKTWMMKLISGHLANFFKNTTEKSKTTTLENLQYY